VAPELTLQRPLLLLDTSFGQRAQLGNKGLRAGRARTVEDERCHAAAVGIGRRHLVIDARFRPLTTLLFLLFFFAGCFVLLPVSVVPSASAS